MPLVTRLLFVFVLVCAAFTPLITRSHSARVSSVRVLGGDITKTSSYSPYGRDAASLSGRQPSRTQNANNVFHSRQNSRDYERFQAEARGPRNNPSVRRAENLNKYHVVVLKSAPGHPLRPSSRNPEEDSRVDAPKMPASTRAQSGVKTVLSSQPGRYLSGRRADGDTLNGIPPARFPLRRPNTFRVKNPDASVIEHGPQLEKPTSFPGSAKRIQSSPFKPSFVRREDFGKSLNSLRVRETERGERKVSTKEEDVARNAARYRATSRVFGPPQLAGQSRKDALSRHGARPVFGSSLVPRTTGRPVPPPSSKAFGKSLGVQSSRWPTSKAFADKPPLYKGKGYAFKMANVYPSLSSKYSFSRRQVEPQTTAAPSTSAFRLGEPDGGLLIQPSNYRVESGSAATRLSDESAVQQIFESLELNVSRAADASPIPQTSLLRRNASGGKEVPPFGTGRKKPQTETVRGAAAGRVVSEGLAEGRSGPFGTSTSSTARGRRVHVARRPGNSPIVRRPKAEPRTNASTAPMPTVAAAVPDVTQLGLRFSSTEVPVGTTENPSRGAPRSESSGSQVSGGGLNEDLPELDYLRISMGNVSFKSL
ncbi:uncharacterized protein LOC133494935 [Syngnathoides biaculeatus]|uniref:uncharacterized protein LOC133494935 n=1 Tax=Syngnathoides biaculeatus TaxID=300417 RepID=UPI002ADD4BA7|nr:uncharacterized protein LOC133494935 [Syngnathoides biaculeatus]XP_061665221.1 uncharacterized protein LOC133494935 [Syngnathoides biaculeatus]